MGKKEKEKEEKEDNSWEEERISLGVLCLFKAARADSATLNSVLSRSPRGRSSLSPENYKNYRLSRGWRGSGAVQNGARIKSHETATRQDARSYWRKRNCYFSSPDASQLKRIKKPRPCGGNERKTRIRKQRCNFKSSSSPSSRATFSPPRDNRGQEKDVPAIQPPVSGQPRAGIAIFHPAYGGN